jgi:iron complex outermembrane receptor protein
VLSGDELVLRRGSSLGETLKGQPGVSSTWFGPNANRPTIRGFDGDRLRILSNSGSSLDASSLSFDHAVAMDPLAVERIEVLRGPAALLYGGNAIGGVVNAIDNRIPKDRLDGVSGSAEVRLGGAERERGGAALVEAGNGRFALHADAFGRRTSDLRVPRYTPVDAEGNVLAATTTVRNSAARTSGGALGGSYTFARATSASRPIATTAATVSSSRKT